MSRPDGKPEPAIRVLVCGGILPRNQRRTRKIIRQAQTNGALILSVSKLLEVASAARN